MNPPWFADSFPQALPGGYLLSQYTRPSFLQWEGRGLEKLLGAEVTKLLQKATEAVSLELSGAVAKPLYVCTTLTENGYCMSMASMSSLLQQGKGRGEYKCRACMRVRQTLTAEQCVLCSFALSCRPEVVL